MKTITAIARTESAAPIDPTAIPAFAPVESDEFPLPFSFAPLTACVAAAVVVAASVVAKTVLPVATEPAVAVSEEEVNVVAVVSAAVTAYPSTQDIEPPTEEGMLACRSSACSPTKSVALLVQSQEPRRSRDVYASDGTEHPAHAHWLAVSFTALHRMRPTHSCSSKSSDFQGHELSVYWESVQPAR